jgi:hypothetical protein
MIPRSVVVAYSDWLDAKDVAIAAGFVDFLFHDGTVLEVGVWTGGWSISHMKATRSTVRVVGIDPFPGNPQIKTTLLANLRAEDLEERFSLYDSWDHLAREDGGLKFSLIHIDGRHTESSVSNDLEFAKEHLDEGGIIVVDDYANPYFPGVASGTHQFLVRNGFRPFLVTEGKMYISRAADSPRLWETSRKLLSDSGRIAWADHYSEPGLLAEHVQETEVLGQPIVLALGTHKLSNPSRAPKRRLTRFATKSFVLLLVPPLIAKALLWLSRVFSSRKTS